MAGPSWEAVREAHERIRARIHRTPVLTSEQLDGMSGARLFFKCENLQKSGSFKIRGATNALFSMNEAEAVRGVATVSSGNHAAALSLAARWRGVPAWVVMPSNTPQVKRQAVEAYGGRIRFCEPTMKGREEGLRALLAETGAALVHPYDDDRVIAGQGTAAKELLEEVPDLGYVLAPVSGGGLLSGTGIAAKSLKASVLVIGCEPKNADDAYRSLESGEIQPSVNPNTIADGLRAQLAPRTFAILRERVDRIALVSEEEIVQAMRLLWERMKIVVEPSGAVGAAVAVFRKKEWEGKRVGVILSGGNVQIGPLSHWRLASRLGKSRSAGSGQVPALG